MYLHYSSAHPRSQKNAVPYGLFLRSRRICTELTHFNKESMDIAKKLHLRGYPTEILLTAYNRARNQERTTLLLNTIKPNTMDEKIRYIVTYNTHNPPIKELINRYRSEFEKNKKQLSFQNIQIVYRRSPNLRDRMITSKLETDKKLGRTGPCSKNCKTCQSMVNSNVITSSNLTSYKINGKFNCQTKNAVYCLTCKTCSLQYVGETSQTVNLRFRAHDSCIRTNKDNPVAQHFNTIPHPQQPYHTHILGKEEDKNKRLRLEESWISLLNTLYPNGLNAKMWWPAPII